MSSEILVVNAGSSSIKYQLVDALSGESRFGGLVERVTSIDQAFADMLRAFEQAGIVLNEKSLGAIGHRVVQGGSEFFSPTLIDDAVAARILALGALAPLHNPAEHRAIEAARALFPNIPHVAVFDTAFHQSMPPSAYTYAIDRDIAAEHHIRRYGFHGTSHQVVSRRAAEFLGRPLESLKQVVLHLGNGASVCAVRNGKSIDTSMGFTPLEGLMMGTRSGDIDPGVLLHLLRSGMDSGELDRVLNQHSGFLGLTGMSDVRDVTLAAESGDAAAQLALDVYVRRIRQYLGAYLVELQGADCLVFTAGVGENAAGVRAAVCANLEWLGIHIDEDRNVAQSRVARRISSSESTVDVLVVPTNEEAEIASQAYELVTSARSPRD